MSDAVMSSLITGAFALIGVVVSNMMAAKKTEKTMAVNQAVMDTKIDSLTSEVREHNNFARRMPVVEDRVNSLEHRVDVLEQYHRQPVN